MPWGVESNRITGSAQVGREWLEAIVVSSNVGIIGTFTEKLNVCYKKIANALHQSKLMFYKNIIQQLT